MPQSIHERQRKIRERVESMSVTRPDDPDKGFWYGVRDDPNYYRYARDDADIEGPLYDVWLDTDARRTKHGYLDVTIAVVVYDCQARCEVDRTTVFSGTFDGHQPIEQAFLLNAHHYEQRAREIASEYVESAEYWADNNEEFFR
jgi:hypothetical protein